jgi:hypothetical protein
LAGSFAGAELGVVFSGAAVFAGAAALTLAFAGTELVFASAGTSAGASGLPDSTETLPVIAGMEISNADTKNRVAAAMVNFESTVAVPRGPKAELEILLVNNAPASVFTRLQQNSGNEDNAGRKKDRV